MDYQLIEYYSAFTDEDLIAEFKLYRDEQQRQAKTAGEIRGSAAHIPGALAQAQQIEREAVAKYGPRLGAITFVLRNRGIDPVSID